MLSSTSLSTLILLMMYSSILGITITFSATVRTHMM